MLSTEGAQAPDHLDVVVAVCTIGDPEGCMRTLAVLRDQRGLPAERWGVVVVDNNAQPRIAPGEPGVHVVHEPRAGIAEARNAAIDAAEERDAHILVFIDDDEVPESPQWLARLRAGLDDYEADAATGPVVSAFLDGTPSAIAAHPVFNRQRLASGTVVDRAASGNLAIRLEALQRTGLRFDPVFSRNGGSDTVLTRRLTAAGHRIVWVDEAGVVEDVPARRATLVWVLRRSRRIGQNRVQFAASRVPGAPPLRFVVPGALAEAVVGLVLAALLRPVSAARAYAWLGRAHRGIGTLQALAGVAGGEYRDRGSAGSGA